MKAILKNPSGNVSIAMLLMVISVMSGFTMAGLAYRDIMSFHYDYESAQSLLLLRSEAYRGQALMDQLRSIAVPIVTSERNVEVTGTQASKTFRIKSLLTPGGTELVDENITQGDTRQITNVHSRVYTHRGTRYAAAGSPRSVVQKYGVFTLEFETFAKFMYFTDFDKDPNGFPIRHYGPDVFYGRVHSNEDIWIRQAGGGSNNNWPTFHGWVTTAGEIRVWPGGGHDFPEDDIFLGGLTENYAYTNFPEEATTLRRNGNQIGPNRDPKFIVYLNVNGSSADAYLGEIIRGPAEQFTYYPPHKYPPGNEEDSIGVNYYSVPDTIWTPLGANNLANRSHMVPNRLWIKGTFDGYQTYGCEDTIFILGDILLRNTPRGDPPLTNKRDVVGLVAWKSIVVKYGYWDPADTLRHHDAVGPGNTQPKGGVWIYAAMAALGNGHGDTRRDGVFTFEYQHPHPSVPDVLINGILYTKIDLHRRPFPQRTNTGWSNNTTQIDYPWYNPLWPERAPYLERGYINVYGSISQRRRGFVHRNYYDQEYPNPTGIWDQTIDQCGGSSAPGAVSHADPVLGIMLTTRDYPGASGTGTGYQKNYHYDDRFYYTSPLDFPEVTREEAKTFTGVKWEVRNPTYMPHAIK